MEEKNIRQMIRIKRTAYILSSKENQNLVPESDGMRYS